MTVVASSTLCRRLEPDLIAMSLECRAEILLSLLQLGSNSSRHWSVLEHVNAGCVT